MDTKVRSSLVMLIDIIFILIGAVNVMELVDILIYKEAYPFGASSLVPIRFINHKRSM